MPKTVQQQSKVPFKVKVMLHARVLLRDRSGKISDVTSDKSEFGYGLEDLKGRASHAADQLARIQELLKLLALATENRSNVDADLVRRVLKEVEMGIEDCSDLTNFVHYTQRLFEEAEPLPPVSGLDSAKACRPLTVLKRAS